MDNLVYYNQLKSVPDNVKKTINGGRLSGMTDIKPQWRIEKLTEVFGPCGLGWYFEIAGINYIPGSHDQIVCSVKINLYIKFNDEWSKPIPGIGGSMFIANEKNGLYTSDEAEKMATTDAISVAAKMLGMGSDVYMGYSDSKYGTAGNNSGEKTKPTEPSEWLNIYTDKSKKEFTKQFINAHNAIWQKGLEIKDIREKYKVSKDTEQALKSENILK